MLLETELLKNTCEKILSAISKSRLDEMRDYLEMSVSDSILHLSVTNSEYFVSVNISLDHTETFHATVNAQQFLKLVAQLTSDMVELTLKDSNLVVKGGSGRYKLPMIYVDNDLLTLKPILLNNVTVDTVVTSDYLHSILAINSRDVAKRSFGSPVQQMYYLDQRGCVTFASGACINNYTVDSTSPFRILLTDSIVKLFKLFDKDETIKLQLGYDLDGARLRSKIKLTNGLVDIYAFLNNDDSLLNSIPVETIRQKADRVISGKTQLTATVDRGELISALSRLEIFSTNKIIKVRLGDALELSDLMDGSTETIESATDVNSSERYWLIDLDKLKSLLTSFNTPTLKLYFEDDSILMVRGSVINIVPTYEQA